MPKSMKGFAGKKVILLGENNSIPFDLRGWREARLLKEADSHIQVLSPDSRENSERYEALDGICISKYRDVTLAVNLPSIFWPLGFYPRLFNLVQSGPLSEYREKHNHYKARRMEIETPLLAMDWRIS